jgi:hypothetical protein
VTWVKTSRAYMDKVTFNRWLDELRESRALQGKKTYLIMDNCNSHNITHPDAVTTIRHDIKVSTWGCVNAKPAPAIVSCALSYSCRLFKFKILGALCSLPTPRH